METPENTANGAVVRRRRFLAIFLSIVMFSLVFPDRARPIPTDLGIMGSTVLQTLMISPDRIWREIVRMSRKSVYNLLDWLTRYTAFGDNCRTITALEKLLISLIILAQGITMREAAFQFGRSESSIHRIFHAFLGSMMIFARQMIHHKEPGVPSKIAESAKYYPFFRDCVGTVDGSHYSCRPTGDSKEAYRNRKGTVSINTMAVVDFDGRFLYVLAGWEGSAHDWRVFLDSITSGFMIPRRKFILGDAGYNNSHRVLVPFRGIRYHLQEVGISQMRPRTPEELYNLRHCELRIVVEMAFGFHKGKWRILTSKLVFPVETLIKVIYATAALVNFILDHDEDGSMPGWQDTVPGPFGPIDPGDNFHETEMNGEEGGAPTVFRRAMAHDMWESYQQFLRVNRRL